MVPDRTFARRIVKHVNRYLHNVLQPVKTAHPRQLAALTYNPHCTQNHRNDGEVVIAAYLHSQTSEIDRLVH